MPTEEVDIMEVSDEVKPALYKTYTTWQIFLTLFSMLFCIVFVGCITAITIITGEKNYVWFYILPAACYIFS